MDGALATLGDLEASVERVRRDGVSRSATAEQVGRMFGIAHAFEQRTRTGERRPPSL